MHLNSELLFKKYARVIFKPGIKILEIGPFDNPSAYKKIVNDISIEWHTLNLENKTLVEMGNKDSLTILTNDPYNYPIKDNTYDIVVSANVMEHVSDIFLWYKELKRIIKNDSYIITVMPLSWPYHEAPVDCWRIYPDGFRTIFNMTGLQEVECVFESLEFEHCYPGKDKNRLTFIPGKSIYWEKSKQQVNFQINWNLLVRKLPFFRRFVIPIEIAFDIISIAKK